MSGEGCLERIGTRRAGRLEVDAVHACSSLRPSRWARAPVQTAVTTSSHLTPTPHCPSSVPVSSNHDAHDALACSPQQQHQQKEQERVQQAPVPKAGVDVNAPNTIPVHAPPMRKNNIINHACTHPIKPTDTSMQTEHVSCFRAPAAALVLAPVPCRARTPSSRRRGSVTYQVL